MRRKLQKKKEAESLQEAVVEARNLAQTMGLEPYDVKYWIVDHQEMDELISYGGFQRRYPHWRWGMTYDQQQKKSRIGGGKAFEIVNNDDPSNAFLQVSNTLPDQKAVITHVEAHADFFANNEWFGMFVDGELDATSMLARHADKIEEYMSDPDIDHEEVEKFIDAISCIENTIDQHTPFTEDDESGENSDLATLDDTIDSLDLTDEVKNHIFNDDWKSAQEESADDELYSNAEDDVLLYLIKHGKQHDEETGRAIDFEKWQLDILRMMRRESYYFAGQRMTKIMNEGWAAYWESMMMAEEQFAGADEFITYADHQAQVLGSPGLNPYKLGKELWEYVENNANRNEVLDKLLRVEGVTWRNIKDTVDLDEVMHLLEPDHFVDDISSETLDVIEEFKDDPRIDAEGLEKALSGEFDVDEYPWKVLTYEGMTERHYSLTKRQNRSFLQDVSQEKLEERARYIIDTNRYSSVTEAIGDVDRTKGWDTMRMDRASHNDITMIDEYLTDEFVRNNNYYAYEFSRSTGDYRATRDDVEAVKKKLLLKFTNFGKPTIKAFDGNYGNQGELLLGHKYNGVQLDIDQARSVLEYMFDLWGRPVNLMTINKDYETGDLDEIIDKIPTLKSGLQKSRGEDIDEPEFVESAERIRYDGEDFEHHPLSPMMVKKIKANKIDYDTKPESWL